MESGFIRIETVTKRFGVTIAVDRVALSIGHGEFFSLLGPSGCGKTTLLRMLGGFALPDEGRILIDGEDVTELPPNRRPTNMVFQSYAIFPHLSVRDNIAYGLRTEPIGRAERDARVDGALRMIKLESYGARRPEQLSGGERQRVALARALVKRPKVLLLDEPLGALDKRLRQAMQTELRQLQREVGITFVFVTHDQEEALSMSDRVAVMEKGRILQIADPKTLYELPQSRAVADFIGTMNVFEGRVAGADAARATVAVDALGMLEVARRPGIASETGARVLVAIRPEKIALGRAPGGGAVKGRILSAAYLGERQHWQIAIEGRDRPVFAAGGGAESFAAGDAVYLGFSPDALLLLPA